MIKFCKHWTLSQTSLQSALNSFIVGRWCYRHKMPNIFPYAFEMQYMYMRVNKKMVLVSYTSATPIFAQMTSGLGWR